MILDHKCGHCGPQLDPKKETGRLIASRPFSFQSTVSVFDLKFETANFFPTFGRGFDPIARSNKLMLIRLASLAGHRDLLILPEGSSLAKLRERRRNVRAREIIAFE